MTTRETIGSGLLLVAVLAGGLGCSGGTEMAILDIEPKVGGTQGDQAVKIMGANFRGDIGYTVYFGSKKAGQVSIVDPETLLATTPSGVPAGQVDVQIRADDGHAFKLPQAFKFEETAAGPDSAAKKAEKGNLAY